MISNRSKHTEAASQQPTRSGTTKAPCSLNPQPRGKPGSAAMEKTALRVSSEDLMEAVVEEANMERAWKKVRSNRGAAGPDGITIKEFGQTFRDQWPTIRQQLLDGTYQPSPARRKSIPKPDGSERHLGIPNVQDRLIQQALLLSFRTSRHYYPRISKRASVVIGFSEPSP